MTPEARRERGVRARVLLREGAFSEAVAAVEADLHREWAASLFSRHRERLHAELRALDRVKRKVADLAAQAGW